MAALVLVPPIATGIIEAAVVVGSCVAAGAAALGLGVAVKKAADESKKTTRQTGGSGEPRRHFKRYPTRKNAQDAAANDSAKGQSPAEHSNPARGRPHFHAVDADGNIKPNGVHYEY